MKFMPWKPRPDISIDLGSQSRVFPLVTRLIGAIYGRLVLRVARVSFVGRERLIEAYRSAVAGEGRFIVAYRHPGDSDPHLVYLALSEFLRGHAPAAGADGRPGAWYPSGKEVQLWARGLVAWALRNAGIVPVRHGAVDRATIDYLVDAVAGRPRPMAIAPEGMATFHRDLVPELDPGTVRIALLAQERLAREGKGCAMTILPLAIDYDYERPTSAARLARFIGKLERRAGLRDGSERTARDRLLAVWSRLLDDLERAYARAYGVVAAGPGAGLGERGRHLAEVSVVRLEAFYGVTPSASLKSRILNIRAEAIDRVFYADAQLRSLSPTARGLAERGAAEAFFLDKIYLTAAMLQFLDPSYLDEPCDFDRLVETAQNLHDLANRLEGKDMRHRTRYFLKDARLVVGEPLTVARAPGEGRKEAAERLQGALARSFEVLIGR